MEVDPLKAKKNDLVLLTSKDDGQNSTKRTLEAFKVAAVKFGLKPLQDYLNTNDGSARRKVNEYDDVLGADRPVNISVDYAYPGEKTTVDRETGDTVSSEASNLGVVVNSIREHIRTQGALSAVAALYDDGADPRLVLGNMLMSWPELGKVVEDMIYKELQTILVAESRAEELPAAEPSTISVRRTL